jgi:hypothetical protein
MFVSMPSFAETSIYTYKDDAGRSAFTTDPDSIPEQYRSRAVPLNAESSPTGSPSGQDFSKANVRVVTASGEYRMGDHDTRADAIRLAI